MSKQPTQLIDEQQKKFIEDIRKAGAEPIIKNGIVVGIEFGQRPSEGPGGTAGGALNEPLPTEPTQPSGPLLNAPLPGGLEAEEAPSGKLLNQPLPGGIEAEEVPEGKLLNQPLPATGVQISNIPTEKEQEEGIPFFPTFSEFLDELATGAEITGRRLRDFFIEGSAAITGDGLSADDLAALEEDRQRIGELISKPAKSVGGEITRNVGRFATAFAPIAFLMSKGGMGPVGISLIGGTVADLLSFESSEERLSNVLADLNMPEVSKAVFEFLAANPSDPKALQIFKQTLEGIAFGATSEAAIRITGVVFRSAMRIKQKQAASAIGVSKENQAFVVRTGDPELAKLDAEAIAIANRLLRQPFEVKRVKVVGFTPEEAKVEILTQEFKKQLNIINSKGLLTEEDLLEKERLFRELARKKFRPPPANDQRANAILEVLEDNERAVKEAQRTTASKLAKKIKENLTKQVYDRSGNIKREILAEGGDEAKKAVMRLELAQGASTKAHSVYREAHAKVFGGLYGKKRDALDRLILLRRLRQIKSYNPDWQPPIDIESRFKLGNATAEDFDQAIDKMRQQLGEEVYADLMRRADAYFAEMIKALNVLKQAGVISANEFKRLSRFEFSPIQFIDFLDPVIAKIGKTGRPISVRSSGIQPLGEGKEGIILTDADMFLGQVIARVYSRAFKNRANVALLKFAEANPNNPVVKLSRAKPGRKRREKIKKELKEEARTELKAEGKQEVKHKLKEELRAEEGVPEQFTEVAVRVGGKTRKIFVRTDLINEWRADPVGVPLWHRLLSGSILVKPFATGINPEFILSNFPRDFLFAWLTAGDGRLFSTNIFRGFAELTVDLAQTARDAALRKGAFNDYIDEGGGMPLLTHQGQLGRQELGMPTTRTKRAITELQHVVGYLNETSEIWMRLAVRNRVLKKIKAQKGVLTPEDYETATHEARRYLDFAQGGEAFKKMDAWVPYLNAGMQGFRGMGRAALRNPKTFSLKMAQLMGTFASIYMANKVVNPEAWAQVPDYIKDRNLVLTTPFFFRDLDGNKRYLYFKLPVDHTAIPFKVLTDALMDRAYEGKIPDDTTLRVLSNFATLVPGVSNLPPSVTAIFATAGNFDFWRKEKIWKGQENLPPQMEFTVTGERPTSKLAIDIANLVDPALEEIGLKDLRMSPARLEVAARALMPQNIYTDAVGVTYKMLTTGLDEDIQSQATLEILKNMPFFRRVVGVTHPFIGVEKDIKRAQEAASAEMKVLVDELELAYEKFKKEGPLGDAQIRVLENFIKAQDPVQQETLKTRLKNMIRIDKIFERYNVADIPGMPPRSWWITMAGADAGARAIAFADQWIQAMEDINSEDEEAVKWGHIKKRMLLRLSAVVPGFNPRKSRKYGAALQREFRLRGEKLPSLP